MFLIEMCNIVAVIGKSRLQHPTATIINGQTLDWIDILSIFDQEWKSLLRWKIIEGIKIAIKTKHDWQQSNIFGKFPFLINYIFVFLWRKIGYNSLIIQDT